jgi:hypothetical protein
VQFVRILPILSILALLTLAVTPTLQAGTILHAYDLQVTADGLPTAQLRFIVTGYVNAGDTHTYGLSDIVTDPLVADGSTSIFNTSWYLALAQAPSVSVSDAGGGFDLFTFTGMRFLNSAQNVVDVVSAGPYTTELWYNPQPFAIQIPHATSGVSGSTTGVAVYPWKYVYDSVALTLSVSDTTVPEPISLGLAGVAVLGMIILSRRR